MNRNTGQILQDLDKHASEFNFPVLDNAYVEFAATRLSAFQHANEWLIVFEVLGFSTREVEFVDDLYAYGSCVDHEGFVGEEIPVRSSPEQPLFDGETRECVADWSHWSIKIGSETISFSPTRGEYAEAGIVISRGPGRGSLSEIELLRFLIHHFGAQRFFLEDNALLRRFPKCSRLRKFVQTAEWQHPNVAEEEKPSSNISIRSLIDALSQKNPGLFKRGRPNTHWKFWVHSV